MTYISLNVTADDVVGAMSEDCGFLYDVWMEIQSGLQSGALMDDSLDMFCGLPNDDQDRFLAAMAEFVASMRSEIEAARPSGVEAAEKGEKDEA